MLSALAVALVPGALGAQAVPAVTVDLAAGSGAQRTWFRPLTFGVRLQP